MNIHKNARLMPYSREELVHRVLENVEKWIARFRAEGTAGLQNRSSRPRHLHRRIPEPPLERVPALRPQRWASKRAATKLDIRRIRARLYTPKTNGKTERFMQTVLQEWAYATAYQAFLEPHNRLADWIHRCNWYQRHGGIEDQVPVSRLVISDNSLAKLYK